MRPLETEILRQPDVIPRAAVEFGSGLLGEGLVDFRHRLSSLATSHRSELGDRRLHADVLLQRAQGSPIPETPTEAPTLTIFLLFDVHRIVLAQTDEGDPTNLVSSVARFALDGCSIQPSHWLLKGLDTEGFRWLHPLSTLDLLPWIWADLRSGRVLELDLRSGQILESRVPTHPAFDNRRGAALPDEFVAAKTVGPSLRSGFPSDLDDLLGEGNVVHHQYNVSNSISLPLIETEIRWKRGHRREACYGHSQRLDHARVVGACEALERFHIITPPDPSELVYDSYRSLNDRAIDPRQLFYGRSELVEESHLPAFDDEARLYWTSVQPLGGGDSRLAPAQEIWFGTQELPGETHLSRTTTSGCALGSTPEEAALFGLLELAERDAFLLMWYLRRSAPLIDPDTVRDEPFHEFRHRWHLAYPNYSFRLFDITTDLRLPAILALALRDPEAEEGPRLFAAAACRLSADRACRAALEDLAGFQPDLTPQRRQEFREALAEPSSLRGPADHFRLYSLEESYDELSFLDLEGDSPGIDVESIRSEALIERAPSYELPEVLSAIARHSQGIGVPLYAKDISLGFVADRGLYCSKAVAPGLLPIWFGEGTLRLARTERLRRMASAFGAPQAAEDLNLGIHPLS
ncbi:MAG: YcaO-like family protein [Acidobacteriota bacterium]